MPKKVGSGPCYPLRCSQPHSPCSGPLKDGNYACLWEGVRVTWARDDLALPMETSDAHAAGTFALLHLIYTHPLKNCWRERKGGAKGVGVTQRHVLQSFHHHTWQWNVSGQKARKCNKEGRCSPDPVHCNGVAMEDAA